MTLYNDITDSIGNTPLVKLNHLPTGESSVFVKMERTNPGGSVKDRAVLSMLDDAAEKGLIKKGSYIVEPTSGNTGIALAMISAVRGYNAILVMPDTMSKERIAYIKAYGAEVVLTPGAKGMSGSIDKANEIAEEKDAMVLGQFYNPANPAAHVMTTGKEILKDLPDADYIVAGFGSGGTISGIGKIVKEMGAKAKIVGVEPAESPLVTKGVAGPHKIQGIGANVVPENLDMSVIDEVIAVKGDDSIAMTKELARKEGIFSGISSGAAVVAALEIAKREKGKKIVAILPDGGDKYISMGIFD